MGFEKYPLKEEKEEEKEEKKSFTEKEINQALKELAPEEEFDLTQVLMGVQVELEHTDLTKGKLEPTMMIALAHLREIPDYYTRLRKMEDEYEEELMSEEGVENGDYDDEGIEDEEFDDEDIEDVDNEDDYIEVDEDD